MSLQFSDTINQQGIIQAIEEHCGFNPGDISGNPTLLASFTRKVNTSLDYLWGIILKACGVWHFDDVNYPDYPLLSITMTNGRREYSFVKDGAGNIVLGFHRVMVSDPSGTFHEIYEVDQEDITMKSNSKENTDSFINGLNATGTPTRYAKTANGIFLDVIPNYAGTIQVFVDREASHFVPTDTVKMPGFVGIFHEYVALRPSYQYAAPKGFKNATDLMNQTNTMERQVELYYTNRNKDVPQRMAANVESTK